LIHFWLPESPDEAEIRAWDPDGEPQRFASGAGHNVLELYRRLFARGLVVSLGAEVPRGARLVVLYAPSLFRPETLRRGLSVIRQARGRFALIRADVPPGFRLPVRPVVEFMPIRATVTGEWQRWLPPLPQRGLLPRREERFGRIRSLAFKGNPENAHPELKTELWKAELAELGIEWWLDAPAIWDGSDQRWHDFSEVDAVLCTRNPAMRTGLERKPATRLINAWRAGCVPFADRAPAYEELGTDGEDVHFIDRPANCLPLLDDLNRDPDRLQRFELRIRARGQDYPPTEILARWQEALLEAADARQCKGWRSFARTAKAAAARVAVTRHAVPWPRKGRSRQ